ncbi:MAG: GvpL/GvpF family gas vesicle protein, partial [Gemmatimonadaceae bacterium]
SQRNPAIGSEALQLFGLIPHDTSTTIRISRADVFPLRELAAVTRPAAYERVDATSDAINGYRALVEELYRDHAVVPAPFGTVFRSRDSLLHWMELHYSALVDALGFVQDRAMARVHVAVVPLSPEALTESVEVRATDFETTVFDSFRFLKRSAVACVTFTPQVAPAGRSVEASFLVDREKWPLFEEAVAEERRRLPELAIEQSGPFPAYDFVRLQFGA